MTHVMNTYGRQPVAFSHGEGVWVWDVHGKRYLDGLSGIAVEPSRAPSIRWYRWLGLSVLVAAIVSFFAAVIRELAAPGAPENSPFFWTAVVCNVVCFVVLPVLLLLAIRFRRLARKEWRAVLMRAVWGGPFGTLGALWDLCADRPDGGGPGK